MCFLCFFGKKHAAFKWKDAISQFPVSPGSAEALVRWGVKIKYTLIAYFLANIFAKKYCNWTVYIKIIASQRWDVFWDSVFGICRNNVNVCLFCIILFCVMSRKNNSAFFGPLSRMTRMSRYQKNVQSLTPVFGYYTTCLTFSISYGL